MWMTVPAAVPGGFVSLWLCRSVKANQKSWLKLACYGAWRSVASAKVILGSIMIAAVFGIVALLADHNRWESAKTWLY